MLLGPLIIDLSGLSLSPPEQHLLTNRHIGGVIFFSRNFQSRKQITSLTSDIRMIRQDLLICVDQEGGRVQRFRDGFTKIPSMRILGEILDSKPKYAEKFIKDCGWLMASEIVACGIDFSFAPVLDLDKDKCQVIADRSFSDNPILATKAAKLFIEGMHEAGMAATGKHFPGHGGVSADSHHETPLDHRSLEELRGHDLVPFASLAGSLDAVMPAHIIYPKIDPNAVGFSELWLKKILRQELKFDGIIFSDDLSMKGADIVGGYTNKAKAALQAGCDMVLVCNNRKGVVEVLNFLESCNWSPSAKLSRMSRQVALSWDSLIMDNRWRLVNAQLLALSEGK